MMTDWEIIEAVENGTMSIKPFDLANINPNSYDITLSDSFHINDQPGVIDPRMHRRYGYGFTALEYTLSPGECILGSSIEYISLPNGIVAILSGKSSVARYNVDIHRTAGYIDAGFCGQITLELCNNNQCARYLLRAGDLIGQLAFYKVGKSRIPYGQKLTSKYQGQIGATPSRYYRNYCNEG